MIVKACLKHYSQKKKSAVECMEALKELIAYQKPAKIYLMSPFQEDVLLVQLQPLNFIIFYRLWPSQSATRAVAWV